jgi:hypothetical protein
VLYIYICIYHTYIYIHMYISYTYIYYGNMNPLKVPHWSPSPGPSLPRWLSDTGRPHVVQGFGVAVLRLQLCQAQPETLRNQRSWPKNQLVFMVLIIYIYIITYIYNYINSQVIYELIVLRCIFRGFIIYGADWLSIHRGGLFNS